MVAPRRARLLERRQCLEQHLLPPSVRTTVKAIRRRQPDAEIGRTKLARRAAEASAAHGRVVGRH
eukprot:1020101-Prymnesium_polylepis.1